jgi:hypothetical protein
LKIHFNIIVPSTTRFSEWSISIRSPQQKPCMHLSSLPCATCPAHLILLDLFSRIIFGEDKIS